MPVKQGTFGTSPIYNGEYKIGKIYKGENLYYVLDDIPEEFIKPFVVPENANTNLLFNPTIKDASAPYKTDIVSGGDLYTLGNNSTNSYNGLIDRETVNSDVTDFYIPSTYNGKPVYSLSWQSLYGICSLYPNLKNIIIGEGIEVLGETSLSINKITALTNNVKVVLPKSLKNIADGALGQLRIYKLDTSLYTFYTDLSRLDKPVENLSSCLTQCVIDICYVNNPIFENDYATSEINNTTFSPLSTESSTYKTTFKKMYVKNLNKLGQNIVYLQTIEYLEIDKNTQQFSATAFNSCSFTDIKFKHSNNDSIEFLLNSSNQGPFYNKSAITANIYTDNDYVRNHDWVNCENITPTFYHLDGTAW